MLKNIDDGLDYAGKISTEELLKRVRTIFQEIGSAGEFKPVAYYDKMLDVIRVITADCSVTEVRITPTLTLLERNHIENGQARYVGFCIEAVSAFCEDMGLPAREPVKISKILEVLQDSKIADKAKGAIREVAVPILEDNGLDDKIVFPD